MEKEQDIFSKLPKESVGVVIAASGALILIGAIHNWDWVFEGAGRCFNIAWACNTFGRKTARILMSIGGSVIILCGIMLFVLM